MFENIKKFMDEFEAIYDKVNHGRELTIDDKIFLEYSDLHFAKSIMVDWGESTEKVAKIILAAKS